MINNIPEKLRNYPFSFIKFAIFKIPNLDSRDGQWDGNPMGGIPWGLEPKFGYYNSFTSGLAYPGNFLSNFLNVSLEEHFFNYGAWWERNPRKIPLLIIKARTRNIIDEITQNTHLSMYS